MGMRRRTRRRAVVATAVVVNHRNNQQAQQQAEAAPPPEEYQEPAPQPVYQAAAPVPPAPDPYDQIEHLAALHASGALTDEEFAAEKAKVLAS